MVAINVKSDVRKLSRRLNRIQRQQLPFATSLAINKTLARARQIVHDEWQKQYADSPRRKKSFPKQVLRWRRSTKQRLVGVLMNVAADDVLRLQMRGGTKTARGSALRVPASNAPRRSKKVPFRAGKYLFLPRKGKDRYVGTLEKSVEVPRKFNLDRALRQIRQAFREELDKAIAKALRTAR